MDSAVADLQETAPKVLGREAALGHMVAELQRENQRPRGKPHYVLHAQFGCGTGGCRKPPKHLPRVRIGHGLPGVGKQCTCGACLVRIGEEASEQHDAIPPAFRVLGQVCFKYTCPVCGQHGVRTAPQGGSRLFARHQVARGHWLG